MCRNSSKATLIITAFFLCAVTSPLFAGEQKSGRFYSPSFSPQIRYMDADLKKLIDLQADKYYNKEWKTTKDQYKAWIACIALSESGNLRSAAHSGGSIGRETFYHASVGEKFPFSTSVGAFQLGNGGNWNNLPIITRIDPEQSLDCVLQWHLKNFGKGSTLEDFQRKSAWFGTKTEAFKECWQKTTGCAWGEKSSSLFHPPMTNATQFNDVAKHIGNCRWNLPGWNGYFSTWLINAKTYGTKGQYSFSYYYAKNDSTGWEVLVWNSHGLVHCYKRNFAATYRPDGIKGNVAGFSVKEPALNPNDIKG